MSVLFIPLMQLVNGAQFLNVSHLFLLSACLAALSFPAPVIVTVPFTGDDDHRGARTHTPNIGTTGW